ncbi:hypothetical protein C2E23DRAFT_726234 [Lenzites betulinus]|nr:hypothetical protein C2E23DRAFT_726234 [Lenzites betulinus]
MPGGLLFVYSEPGSAVSTEEFNDWYDNEHVPLRLPIPGFQTWSRWAAVDGKTPSYAAVYGLSAPSVASDPAHAHLGATRSDREKSIMSRASLIDRRTYALCEPAVAPSAGYDRAQPGPFVCIAEVDIKPEAEADFNRWYDEEHIPMLSRIPGWVRSSRFVLVDAAAAGADAGGVRAAKYFALHEIADLESMERPEFKASLATEWSQKILGNTTSFSLRVFKLTKSWKQ